MKYSMESFRISRALFQSPARISVLGFALLITAGTALLMLPVSSTGGRQNFIDALFTATSASCVTGLTVVDTGSSFSIFGQIVTLALIQIGGIGITTLSTVLLLMAGRRPSLTERMVIQDTFTHGGGKSIYSVVRDVIGFSFLFEGIGAVLLFIRFFPEYGALNGFYLSIYHSISAFCNAGFSLFPDNLMQYSTDWLVSSVIGCLIISGGLGFIVFSELKRQFPFKKRIWHNLSLHSKLVLSTTAILLVASTLGILFMEWSNTLKNLSVPNRFLASWFQAVTSRTAGYNTLPIGDMADQTLLFIIFLMFVGASPGSCAGGIKTTTLAGLILTGISRFRGHSYPRVFNRTIPESCIGKSINIVMISVLVVYIATMVILMSDLGEIPHHQTRGKFLDLLFEVVSAFGTVGLSTGITGTLSFTGKLVITLVMFMGRLGPLVVALAISQTKTSRIRYAEEQIMVG